MRLLALSVSITTLLSLLLAPTPSRAALSLEGQNGVFLNSLAYPVAAGKLEASTHYVNLNRAGNVYTTSVAAGLKGGVELGYTRLVSDVDGVRDQNVLNAKWQFLAEKKGAPALAAWVQYRDVEGKSGGSAFDYGLSTTKILTAAKRPLVLDLGVRFTKAKALGLFGFGGSVKAKLEASVAYFVTPHFAIGAELKEQIGSRTWKDIAFRFVASDALNLDAGIANLGPSINNQIALGATYKW